MNNYKLDNDEVILYEGPAGYNGNTLSGNIILTSKRIIVEKTKGIFKKETELIDVILLENIKIYNDVPQCKQKGNEIQIQCTDKNISLYFSGMVEAAKVNNKIIDTISGTTMSQRGAKKVDKAITLVDETLGFDTRGTVKGFLENGIKGSLINGIKKKK